MSELSSFSSSIAPDGVLVYHRDLVCWTCCFSARIRCNSRPTGMCWCWTRVRSGTCRCFSFMSSSLSNKRWNHQTKSSCNFGNSKEFYSCWHNSAPFPLFWLQCNLLAYIFRMKLAAFRGLPTIEEHMKQGLKKAEAAMDSVVDSLPSKNAAPEVLEHGRSKVRVSPWISAVIEWGV